MVCMNLRRGKITKLIQSVVFTFVPDLSGAKGAANKIVQLFDREIEIDAESPAGKQVQSLQGSIIFKK